MNSLPTVADASYLCNCHFKENPDSSCVALFVETTEGLFKFNRDGSYQKFSQEELNKLNA